jgi:hypothetical protein
MEVWANFVIPECSYRESSLADFPHRPMIKGLEESHGFRLETCRNDAR